MTEKTGQHEFIPCDGCGQYFIESELRRCADCGKVYCPECRKTHICEEAADARCDACGRLFPKTKLLRCRECGDVLCPDCRKKHDCTGEKNEPKDHSLLPVIITIIICAALVIGVWVCVSTGTSPLTWFTGEPIAGTSWTNTETGTVFEFYSDKTAAMITPTETYSFTWQPSGERTYIGGGYTFYLSQNESSLSVTDGYGSKHNYIKTA